MRTAVAVVLMLSAMLRASSAGKEVPLLNAGDKSYTNVVVDRETETHLFILHAGGMAAVKVIDLDAVTRSNLGILPVVPSIATNAAAEAASKPKDPQITAPPKTSTPILFVAVSGTLVIGLVTWVCVLFFRNKHEWSTRAPRHGYRTVPFPPAVATTPPMPPAPPEPPVRAARSNPVGDHDIFVARSIAAFSFYAPFAAVCLAIYSAAAVDETPFVRMVLGLISMGVVPAGFICGVVALFKVRRYGSAWILKRAIAGTIFGGLLIALMVAGISTTARMMLAGKSEEAAAVAAEENVGREFPVLKIEDQSFTNVVITRQSEANLFITHDAGMSTIHILDLDFQTQTNLGITPLQIFKASRARAEAGGSHEKKESAPVKTPEELEKLKNSFIYVFAGVGVIIILLLVFAWRWLAAFFGYLFLAGAALSLARSGAILHTGLLGGFENSAYWFGYSIGGIIGAVISFVVFKLLENLSEWKGKTA